MTPRPCPCGLPEPFDACCGRYLGPDGAAPPTAEALMRSRFTAFARGDAEHLLRTWHPDTRPRTLDLDPARRWERLEILDRSGGALFDREGVVEFRAHHRDERSAGGTSIDTERSAGGTSISTGPRTGVQQERSRFVREGGRWVYLDGGPGQHV